MVSVTDILILSLRLHDTHSLYVSYDDDKSVGLALNLKGVGQMTMFTAAAGGGDCFSLADVMDRSEGCIGEWVILRFVGDSQGGRPPDGRFAGDAGEFLLTAVGDSEVLFCRTAPGGQPKYRQG